MSIASCSLASPTLFLLLLVGVGRKSGLVSLAPWTCARPRAELSKGHDSIIRELKSTASKSLVASLSESTGQNYKHIAIQKLQILTLKSPSPINTLLSIGIRI